MPSPHSLFFRNSDHEIQKRYREKKWLIERLLTGVLSKDDELKLVQEGVLSTAACRKYIKMGVFSEEAKPSFIKYYKKLYYIIELADENLALRQLCLSEKLTDFWRNLVDNPKEFKKRAKWPNDNFTFKQQPLIPVFDLISGIYFNDRGRREKKYAIKQNLAFQSNDLNRAALRYHFFPALLKLMGIKELWRASKEKSNEDFLKEINLKLEQAESAIPFHGTPAYILCAHLSICLGQYYRNNITEAYKASAAYGRALIYYELAEHHRSKSGEAIYNAYQGQGIAASNVQRYDEIADLQAACINLAGDFLLPFQIQAGKKLIEGFKQFAENEPTNSIRLKN